MVEKLLNLQYIHQKEYNQIFNSINTNKKFVKNYKNLYILLTKKINKLHTKKLEDSLKKTNNKFYNESLSNFSKERRKILQDYEFSIWNKLKKNSKKSFIIENSKNKMINIFLNICSKKEKKLNKLSLKFYNEIKEKQNKKMNNKKNEILKKNKYKNTTNKKITIAASNNGTVTSVAASGSGGITISGSPITTSGTITTAITHFLELSFF